MTRALLLGFLLLFALNVAGAVAALCLRATEAVGAFVLGMIGAGGCLAGMARLGCRL